MKNILIYLILATITAAQLKDCPPEQRHSSTYQELVNDINSNVQFNTWKNTCQDMTIDYQKNYIELLNATNTKCQGKLCVDGLFICRPGNYKCYGINHIVLPDDLNQYCNINIAVNLIMSWRYWNIMSELELCMRDLVAEKMEVFGSNIYCTAINQLKKCNDPRCNFVIPPICVYPPQGMAPGGVAVLVILILALIIFGGSACYIYRSRIAALVSNYRRI